MVSRCMTTKFKAVPIKLFFFFLEKIHEKENKFSYNFHILNNKNTTVNSFNYCTLICTYHQGNRQNVKPYSLFSHEDTRNKRQN